MAKVKKTTRKNPKTKAGTEITSEIADALAAEAERGGCCAIRQVIVIQAFLGQG